MVFSNEARRVQFANKKYCSTTRCFNIFISSRSEQHDNNCLLKLPNTNNWVIFIYALRQKQHIWLAANNVKELNCSFFPQILIAPAERQTRNELMNVSCFRMNGIRFRLSPDFSGFTFQFLVI